jgi:hypothetical protein
VQQCSSAAVPQSRLQPAAVAAACSSLIGLSKLGKALAARMRAPPDFLGRLLQADEQHDGLRFCRDSPTHEHATPLLRPPPVARDPPSVHPYKQPAP